MGKQGIPIGYFGVLDKLLEVSLRDERRCSLEVEVTVVQKELLQLSLYLFLLSKVLLPSDAVVYVWYFVAALSCFLEIGRQTVFWTKGLGLLSEIFNLFRAFGSWLGSLKNNFWFYKVGAICLVIILHEPLLFHTRKAPIWRDFSQMLRRFSFLDLSIGLLLTSRWEQEVVLSVFKVARLQNSSTFFKRLSLLKRFFVPLAWFAWSLLLFSALRSFTERFGVADAALCIHFVALEASDYVINFILVVFRQKSPHLLVIRYRGLLDPLDVNVYMFWFRCTTRCLLLRHCELLFLELWLLWNTLIFIVIGFGKILASLSDRWFSILNSIDLLGCLHLLIFRDIFWSCFAVFFDSVANVWWLLQAAAVVLLSKSIFLLVNSSSIDIIRIVWVYCLSVSVFELYQIQPLLIAYFAHLHVCFLCLRWY